MNHPARLSLTALTLLASCGSEVIFLGPRGDGGGGGEAATTTVGAGGQAATVAVSTTTSTVSTGGAGSGGSEPLPCTPEWIEPTPIVPPVDVIMVVDNSGSMSNEIDAIEQNINVNFAQVIAASGIDQQLIVISQHGQNSYDLCIGPPLSSTSNCAEAPGEVPGKFHHYSVNVQSFDPLCRIAATLSGSQPDAWGLHPNGWIERLRVDAKKAFVVFTDDRVNCTHDGIFWNDANDTSPAAGTSQAAATAIAFDSWLLGHAPQYFGSVADRDYFFYSVVGVTEKQPATNAYLPWEPIEDTKCDSAVNTGPGYQWLSKGTDGGRYPICAAASYDALFLELASDIIAAASLPCQLELTALPPDPSAMVVKYTDPNTNQSVLFHQVSGLEACGESEEAFYLSGLIMQMCPATCDAMKVEVDATIEVLCE